MKLKYNFVVNQVADKMVAVPVGNASENFNGFIKMNDIGAFIFGMLKNDVTEDDIVAAMVKEYQDATEAEIRDAVHGFVAQLIEKGIVE